MQKSVKSPPAMIWYMLVISPVIMIPMARARMSGQYDVGGMWIAAISAAVTGAGFGRGLPPWSSPYLATQKSSRPWTSGTRAKLYTGGGDGMLHSSVRASQGSGPATWPERADLITFPMNSRNEHA